MRCLALLIGCGGAVSRSADMCDESVFAENLVPRRYLGLSRGPSSAATEEACRQACCDDGDNCSIYQLITKVGSDPECWIGQSSKFVANSSIVTASRGRAASVSLQLDDSNGFGLVFEGVGAISGGGATSKLLMDYPEPARSDLLDYLFKPNFGLSLQILKVEIGGDTDSTEGAEPSHMHAAGDANYQRGYEWWLMREAKLRNPDIKFYGLPWGWPGWLDPSATSDDKAQDPFADPAITANYTVEWLLAARREHNLTIDFVGQWNERDAPRAYAAALREAVETHTPWTQTLDRMVHYAGTGTVDPSSPKAGQQSGNGKTMIPDPNSCDTAAWNRTTRGWVDEEGSTYDYELPSNHQENVTQQSARCLARCVNRNYITQCRTATIQWHLISSFYDYLPWRRCGVGVANTPWSGAYEITSPAWALAHTTQFSAVGWRYLRHGSGVGLLPRGGSYVTRVSPDGREWSMVVEKMAQEQSACTRGSNPPHETAPETLTFRLAGGLRRSELQLWYSDLSRNDSPALFVRKGPIAVGEDGTFRLRVERNEIFTVTTLRSGRKGFHASPPPAPFPAHFADDFEASPLSSPPRYWYDQMGAWEIHANPLGSGRVMRQMSTVWPACWGYSCSGPTTYFGPERLNSTVVSMDVMLEDDGEWSLNGDDKINPTLSLSTSGEWVFGTQKGSDAPFAKNRWHKVKYIVAPSWHAASVDGSLLANVTTGLRTTPPDSGTNPGLKMQLNRYMFASIDNLDIRPVYDATSKQVLV